MFRFQLAVCAVVVASVFGAAPLAHYGARRDAVSISGISSGAFMSVQMHVTYSSSIMGVGVVAGGPYYCARGSTWYALNPCMATGDINVDYLANDATDYAYATRTIDHTSNMQNDNVFILSGTKDSVVVQDVTKATEEYYSYFISSSRIKAVYNVAAEHSMVTDSYGNSCSYKGSPYINNCGYNAAFEILNHIYGGLARPTGSTAQDGDFLTFDQSEYFIGSPSGESVANSGYVYVPTGCKASASNCKVHLALHGCDQQSELLGDEYARHAGYSQVAELNDIIMVYPQTIARSFNNPNGCWDWWGYNTSSYASNLAPQMKFLKKIIDRVVA